jgi:hypothetical protein
MASTAHHDERAPERTTPQGTQEAGVEHGHEAADMDIAQVGGWFLGLAVTVIVAMILLWGTFKWWARTATHNDELPSQLFTQRMVPPEPRILPNPIDYPETQLTNPRADAPDYPESLPGERDREDKELQRLGLQDHDTGLPRLPDNAVASVITATQKGGSNAVSTSGPATPLAELRPSVASGGTVLENDLR